jgi:hypothetical protein
MTAQKRGVTAMKRILFAIMMISLGATTACSRYPTMQPPLRDADVYPNVRTEAGLSVAVDPISNPERVRQYFGADLTKEDILPVNIIMTNHGEDAFLVKPQDVLLLEGDSVVDPLTLEQAGKSVKGGEKRMEELAFQEKVIPPTGSYQGMLLFKIKKRESGLYARVEKFFTDGLSLRIVVTDRDSGERITFGPYSLAGT